MPDGCVVIRLPDPRVLRVIARSVLLAVALLSLAWLRDAEAPAGDALQVGLLLRDLRREGLLAPGARAVFLGAADGDCHHHPPALDGDDMRRITPRELLTTGDLSVDFVLDFGYFDKDGDRVGLVDRVLKDGGIFAAPIGSASEFRLPPNYRVVYIRRFTETFVGIKKIARVGGDNGIAGARTGMAATTPALKEGVLAFSAQTADTALAELKNFRRKLLLPHITGASAAHAHQAWLKLRHRPVIAVDFPAMWNVNKLQPAHPLVLQDKAVHGAQQQQLNRSVRLNPSTGY
ncbi:uncharacterized protein [Oryza sativa Japonica Group]|jgi:hypothetical protein|uniref:Os02g0760400 protein n=2 Tax=Oryza sativa subsp. japonica TaxID=39947 RepID=Q6K8D3_ORYSJ|nr:uncharacterized protein LOC4330801 [Oryza sativa Japonica Group]KAB8089012.1 hypothetical protein EE612_013817 [Oryza sativa]EEE57844.1 hypothetical protein OsJ_08467 [Oryza sativa Japonica Group]KAF2947070.1 hypothetical protein DAI22_02g341600 [Oryza sativa Japonica Group]BAD19405.1 unknown protein [Oryza sativa Japonica Group]BAF10103.1 Os02g0760400 [Oryza sativa Japonica Group]|eukprot:NP_001048189.1 Os02g0760400 [Oryza sativa Japonica Group]